ncbi:LysE family translocator [Thalassospira lohafexi]|uniref:Threonine transporter RhtB n=1 Tax=Thalassospira lohafexi TaxID=744227 RepID=A0A2N3L3B4_9PROT|nr:LysE family translocator [Thalassospira lohafexi]PKR57313.1 threonine transporter RhtB [Thalassospira lohafexi]
MTYAENLWLFFILLSGIIIVPGMDMFFVIANSLTGGKRAGLSATAGIMLGGVYHTLLGAIGISALLAIAPWLLNVMLFVGAAYMVWIGITLLRSAITVDRIRAAKTASLWIAFRQGMITCILNPKAYLFIFAVYPQFIRPHYGPLWSQALVMGIMTAIVQLAVYGGLALAAGTSRTLMTGNPVATIFIGRAAGALFIGVALLTAWQGMITFGITTYD